MSALHGSMYMYFILLIIRVTENFCFEYPSLWNVEKNHFSRFFIDLKEKCSILSEPWVESQPNLVHSILLLRGFKKPWVESQPNLV